MDEHHRRLGTRLMGRRRARGGAPAVSVAGRTGRRDTGQDRQSEEDEKTGRAQSACSEGAHCGS
ncbi:hypothetical protein GCM10022221_23300 [Actinocorallia aurea]